MSCWPYTTRRWERLRRVKLATHPCCEACLQVGEVVPAEVVDHRNPISERGRKERRMSEAFPPLEGLASLCAPHHNAKTNAEQRGEDYWRKGCDIFGRPLDPESSLEQTEMRGTTFPTRRPFYDFGADHESDMCRQQIHDRLRRAASKALAELRQRQRLERKRYGEATKADGEG